MTSTTEPGREPDAGEEPQRTGIVRIVGASLVGTAVEWYDFFLFGSAAALVFGEVFFGEIGGTNGTLYAFMTYALGFIARPLGGVVFGHFGDKVGRKAMLVTSLLMMGVGTFLIGLLPTYATIGIAAPILLVLCRLIQGFAVGGEWGGAVLMAAEHGRDEHRGFWSSWPQAGVALGNLLATAVLFVLAAVQSEADFNAWGWRIPFLLSAVLVIVGLYVRLSIEESPVFKEAKEEIDASETGSTRIPIVEVIKEYPREVFTAMGMRMAENISYYIFTVIVLTYAADYTGIDDDVVLRALVIGAAIQFFVVPAVGAWSDRIGRKPLYLAGAVGVGVWTFVFFDLVDTGSSGLILLAVVVGLVLHSLMYAPQAAYFSELFGTSVRYTGASVGYQLASIFAGALAPIIALQLLGDPDSGGNTAAVGVYVAIAAVITVVAVLFSRETAKTSLRHDRAVPAAHD